MHAAQVFSANATTFLTHIVGRGLVDERYVVQRFKSMIDGDIRLIETEAPKGKRRSKAKHTLASLADVKETACDLLIDAAGLCDRSGKAPESWPCRRNHRRA